MELWDCVWWLAQVSCLTEERVNQEKRLRRHDYLRNNFSSQIRWFNLYSFELPCFLEIIFLFGLLFTNKRRTQVGEIIKHNTSIWGKMWNLSEIKLHRVRKKCCICRAHLLSVSTSRETISFTDLSHANKKRFVHVTSTSVRNRVLAHSPHLKHILCHFSPPATLSSAA